MTLQVGVRAKARRPFGRQPFHVAAKGDVVEHRLVMGCEQLDQRGRKGRAQHIGHKDARPGPADQQARGPQDRAIASRSDGRETPSLSARSRSDGSRSPGRRMPRRISCSICRTTDCDSFSGATFWNGMAVPPADWSGNMTDSAGVHNEKGAGQQPGPLRSRMPRSARRADDDFDPAVLRAALGRQVRRDRLILAPAEGRRRGRPARRRRAGRRPPRTARRCDRSWF